MYDIEQYKYKVGDRYFLKSNLNTLITIKKINIDKILLEFRHLDTKEKWETVGGRNDMQWSNLQKLNQTDSILYA